MEQVIPKQRLTCFPRDKQGEVDEMLAAAIKANNQKIVVLDDDPTGVQTVHDVSVYTDWSPESLREGFEAADKMFFVLTNSRGMTQAETLRVHEEIIQNVELVSRETGRSFIIVSRSDSTLRGHYPLETITLARGIERAENRSVDGEILCPYFREGGRFTMCDIHYVAQGNELVPAAQTEFAKDSSFGYHHSDLRLYIEEKTQGSCSASTVISISLDELRTLQIDEITEKLMRACGYQRIIVNATDDMDVKVFCIALYRAIGKGKCFCYRTAAAFVKAIGGIGDKPLLIHKELLPTANAHGGIIVVGSHTKKTTDQLMELLTLPGLQPIELDSDLVMQGDALEREAERVATECSGLVKRGITPVVYTKRTLLTFPTDTHDSALLRSVRISGAVQSVVAGLTAAPAFVIAKGGITSSDIGVKAMKVRHAVVLGQICPGVPVWRTGEESIFPRSPYVIFPGNVGDSTTLRTAAEKLLNSRQPTNQWND